MSKRTKFPFRYMDRLKIMKKKGKKKDEDFPESQKDKWFPSLPILFCPFCGGKLFGTKKGEATKKCPTGLH